MINVICMCMYLEKHDEVIFLNCLQTCNFNLIWKSKTSNYMYKSQKGNLTIRFYTALAFSCGAREKRKDINNCPFYYWYLLKSKTLHLCQSCMCWKWFRTSTSCSVHWFSWFSPSFWWPGHRHVCHIPPDSCFWWRSVLIQNWIKA